MCMFLLLIVKKFSIYFAPHISVELGFLGDFVLLSLKTYLLYQENIFTQKFKIISSQFRNNIFSASDKYLKAFTECSKNGQKLSDTRNFFRDPASYLRKINELLMIFHLLLYVYTYSGHSSCTK